MSINIYNAAEDKLTHLAGMNCFADSPIGTIIGSLSTVTPTGYLYCDNTAYSAESYPELWAVLPNSVKDTTNNTFTIDLRETSLKGEGLTSLSNNHYSSAGLSLGEFIDDRVQEHTHAVDYNSPQSGIPGNGVVYDDTTQKTNLGTNSGRSGATTEVKSRAVRWYIKAKMVAMPSDFMSKVDEAVEEVFDSGLAHLSAIQPNEKSEQTILFNKTFSTPPIVVCNLYGTYHSDELLLSAVLDVTTTGFKVRVASTYNERALDPYVSWMAKG